MALGGGTFTVQNKVLPGAYFQFISKMTASANIGDRGVVAVGLELDWGVDGSVFTVTVDEFIKNSLKIFGHDYTAAEMQTLREIFCHASKVHVYKLTGGGVKAANTYATAKYAGTRGNDLKVVIQANVDNEDAFDVSLYLGTVKVDEQTVTAASALVDNDYVTWQKDASLAVTAGLALSGGTDVAADTTAHQTFLNKIEAFPDTNAIAYLGTEDTVKSLYTAFAARMRDAVGIKLQAVVHGKTADSEAVVNVKNDASIVPWVVGVVAGTAVNASATNMKYDGELTVNTDYTQAQLEAALLAGEFVLHQVGDEVRILEDINSLVTTTDEKGDIFKDNQTIRVVDAIATSVAEVFSRKYIGKVPNNAAGRTSLWSDIVKICQQLNNIQALEDFDPQDVVVAQGDTKKSIAVDCAVTVVNTMTKLYMRSVLS